MIIIQNNLNYNVHTLYHNFHRYRYDRSSIPVTKEVTILDFIKQH